MGKRPQARHLGSVRSFVRTFVRSSVRRSRVEAQPCSRRLQEEMCRHWLDRSARPCVAFPLDPSPNLPSPLCRSVSGSSGMDVWYRGRDASHRPMVRVAKPASSHLTVAQPVCALANGAIAGPRRLERHLASPRYQSGCQSARQSTHQLVAVLFDLPSSRCCCFSCCESIWNSGAFARSLLKHKITIAWRPNAQGQGIEQQYVETSLSGA